MHKKTILLVFILILMIAYSSYTVFSYNNRTAGNLSAYCNIDFRGVVDPQTTTVTGATLEMVDFHYGANPLEKFFLLTIDGKQYTVDTLESSAQPPTYSLKDFPVGMGFKYTNTLFITFPPQILKEISKANKIIVSFKYAGNTSAIELPLSAVDLQYWKHQLPTL